MSFTNPDGFLRITDRKKDLIATAGARKTAPQNIERLLQRDALDSHALIVGDRRPSWALAPARWRRARRFGNACSASSTRLTRELARPEQIKRFAVLPRDFCADEFEITPTLKLKRRVCEQHFATELGALYPENGSR